MCINNVPSAILQYPNQREGVKESHSSSRHFCLRNEVQTEPASPPRAYTVLLVRCYGRQKIYAVDACACVM